MTAGGGRFRLMVPEAWWLKWSEDDVIGPLLAGLDVVVWERGEVVLSVTVCGAAIVGGVADGDEDSPAAGIVARRADAIMADHPAGPGR